MLFAIYVSRLLSMSCFHALITLCEILRNLNKHKDRRSLSKGELMNFQTKKRFSKRSCVIIKKGKIVEIKVYLILMITIV